LRADTLQILNAGGLTGDNAARIASLSKSEFDRNAGLSEFLLLSIALRIGEFWGSSGALPASEVSKLQAGLLPPLKIWLANDRSFRDPTSTADLLLAVRDSLP
jgi:hypothetical protein